MSFILHMKTLSWNYSILKIGWLKIPLYCWQDCAFSGTMTKGLVATKPFHLHMDSYHLVLIIPISEHLCCHSCSQKPSKKAHQSCQHQTSGYLSRFFRNQWPVTLIKAPQHNDWAKIQRFVEVYLSCHLCLTWQAMTKKLLQWVTSAAVFHVLEVSLTFDFYCGPPQLKTVHCSVFFW